MFYVTRWKCQFQKLSRYIISLTTGLTYLYSFGGKILFLTLMISIFCSGYVQSGHLKALSINYIHHFSKRCSHLTRPWAENPFLLLLISVKNVTNCCPCRSTYESSIDIHGGGQFLQTYFGHQLDHRTSNGHQTAFVGVRLFHPAKHGDIIFLSKMYTSADDRLSEYAPQRTSKPSKT